KCGLRRQHSALNRKMDSLEALRVEESSGIAKDHPAIAGNRRNRIPAPVRQRLRAIADHLAAFKQFGDEGMLLENLQHTLRIEPRVRIVEAGYEPQRHNVVLAAVNPGA